MTTAVNSLGTTIPHVGDVRELLTINVSWTDLQKQVNYGKVLQM